MGVFLSIWCYFNNVYWHIYIFFISLIRGVFHDCWCLFLTRSREQEIIFRTDSKKSTLGSALKTKKCKIRSAKQWFSSKVQQQHHTDRYVYSSLMKFPIVSKQFGVLHYSLDMHFDTGPGHTICQALFI